MLSEYFVDTCLVACCSINTTRVRAAELFNNMHVIFKWYNEEVPKELRPLEFQDKALLAFYLCQTRKSKSDLDLSDILSRLQNGKFGHLVPLLESIQEDIDEEKFNHIFDTILQKRKVCELTRGKIGFQKLLADIDSGSFVDDEEIIKKWEEQISLSHSQFMTLKRQDAIGKAESFDIRHGNISNILDKVRESSNEQTSLRTGFELLRKVLPAKGFEDRRLYLIGGSSGVGKSAMLINLIVNAIQKNVSPDEKPAMYLYITAENLIDESWIRYYCCLTGTPHSVLIKNIKINREKASLALKAGDEDGAQEIQRRFDNSIQNKVFDNMQMTNANAIFKYVQSKRTTVKELESLIDTVSQAHNIRAIFIDYLDLITTGLNLEYRHELGVVTQCFKNFAVSYNCPVITATQLNREGYRPDSEPSLTQMGESMQKVDASDFILFLQKAKKPITKWLMNGKHKKVKRIRATVLKNRNGLEGDSSTLVFPMNLANDDIFNFKIEEVPENIVELDEDKIAQDDVSNLDGGNMII